MEAVSAAYVNQLFSATYESSFNTGFIASASLSRGMDAYEKGNYETSIADFKRAIGLAPGTENAAKAFSLLGMVYTNLDRTEEAVAVYKEYMRSFPLKEDPHIKLGNIYFGQKKYDEAETEYRSAVNLNSQSVKNWYSLGQVYLATERYDEAEDAFTKITQISPQDYSGYYALGQTYYKRGEYQDAVRMFGKVTEMKRDFAYVHVDLGYAYADMGDLDAAREQAKILSETSEISEALLSEYIYKVSEPRMLAAYSPNGFNTTSGPGTSVSSLDSSLAAAGASKDFTMNFIFNKEMDGTSVRDPYNWQLTRAIYGTPGGAYNWGLSVPTTEVSLNIFPEYVIYDPDSLTAEVTFSVTQNASADATIDPSHVIFRFAGKDVYGNTMDASADQYGGFSKIV